MKEPIIITRDQKNNGDRSPASVIGKSFVIHEWSGSGPDYLHVHYEDDEAWHVLEGTLTFKFVDKEINASPGTTVYVPAGVVHTYWESAGPSRYLMILTPRLDQLIAALHDTPYEEHNSLMKKFKSEIIEQ